MFKRSGIAIFRIAGIQIFIDRSWFFIFFILTWSLAVGVFPSWHPKWDPLLNFVTAICAALLFFGSVLLHELAHALVGKARGLRVRNITLFVFGGVSNIEREPKTARTEFLMAIVGPLTSVAIGVLFLLAGSAAAGLTPNMNHPLTAVSKLDPLETLMIWVGPVNIVVGLFNMVPGFPLDGGRIVRSALWAATGSFTKATNIATRIGQLIGWLFMFAGAWMAIGIHVPILGTGLLNGLWLVFIGWFLQSAADQSREQAVVQDLLADVPVERFMRDDVRTVPSEANVKDVVENWFLRSDEKSFPIMRGPDFIGVVTLRDVRKVPKERWTVTQVTDIMMRTDQLAVVQPEEDTAEAFTLLNKSDLTQLPVMKNGHFLGVIRAKDILRWLQLQKDFT